MQVYRIYEIKEVLVRRGKYPPPWLSRKPRPRRIACTIFSLSSGSCSVTVKNMIKAELLSPQFQQCGGTFSA